MLIIPDMSYVLCLTQVPLLVCSVAVSLSLITAGDAGVRQLWFLTYPASQQDWVPSSLIMDGSCEGMKGKEACGEEVSSVTEGQMLSVS